jgi:hypothetical protein
MTEKSYQDAVQVLKDRLGGRWEGMEANGRDEMVGILKEQLGYDSRAANDAIDAMIASGVLRYHSNVVERPNDDATPLIPVAGGMSPTLPASGGLTGVPIAPAVLTGAGYWQIGRDEGDEPGRAGQVNVDY